MQQPFAITGASGFIGLNLTQRLRERGFDVRCISHTSTGAELKTLLTGVQAVFHLAGVNRPRDESEFGSGNRGFTEALCQALMSIRQPTPIVYASSLQAAQDNAYGRSKLAAEGHIASYAKASGAPAYIVRLPNVFGKWGRPDYNSVVATFCHRIARGLDVTIHDPSAPISLVYIDDVVERFIALAQTLPEPDEDNCMVSPVYRSTVGELNAQLLAFHASRETLVAGPVGLGFARALHATYLSYLPPSDFEYPLVAHVDPRGMFAEMLRTPDCGQFSYFTAHPGVTRGGHYHHSKTEKFLVVVGQARYGFRHIVTNETYEIFASGEKPVVVETVPGWTHDITNIGDTEMVVLLWANEVFDKENPDTFAAKV